MIVFCSVVKNEVVFSFIMMTDTSHAKRKGWANVHEPHHQGSHGTVHTFDLAVSPRVVGLGEAMLDAMLPTGTVKRMTTPERSGTLPVFG